jgi:hypothetical protein
MLRFTISLDRRRPVGEAAAYVVTGACEPPEFDSLSEARLFVQRETAKYRNGSLLPFEPTHSILWQPPQSPAVKRRIPVRMIITSEQQSDVPVALYKEEDWKPCIIPEWNYDRTVGRLLLDGVLMGFSWKLMSYAESLANFAVLAAREAADRGRFLAW